MRTQCSLHPLAPCSSMLDSEGWRQGCRLACLVQLRASLESLEPVSWTWSSTQDKGFLHRGPFKCLLTFGIGSKFPASLKCHLEES